MRRKQNRISIACLTLLLFAGTSEAQRIVERLADGSFVVEIEGKEFRAFGADKMRELMKQKVDIETLTAVNSEKDKAIAAQTQEIELLKKDVEIVGLQRDSFKSDFDRSREDGARWRNLFMTERDLRREASNFIPRGEAKGFAAKLLNAVNSQAFQVGIKIALPIANTFGTYMKSARCQ